MLGSLEIVVKPGNPPYLEYVRSTVEEKRKKLQKGIGMRSDKVSKGEKQEDDSEPQGNPNLIYESKLVEGWEPSGVPVCDTHLPMLTMSANKGIPPVSGCYRSHAMHWS